MQAKDLRVGESCEFPGLENFMRNGICLRQSLTSTQISYEERKSPNSSWSRITDYIACSSRVIPVEKEFAQIEQNSSGETVIAGGLEKKKRGRKGVQIEFPKERFTVAELAEKFDCSTTNIYLKVQAEIKAGNMQEFVEPRKEGQRGKPKKSYQIYEKI